MQNYAEKKFDGKLVSNIGSEFVSMQPDYELLPVIFMQINNQQSGWLLDSKT